MPCAPIIRSFFPIGTTLAELVVGPNPFSVSVKNDGKSSGTIAVEFTAQPALTSGTPQTWHNAGATVFSNVGAGASANDTPTLMLNEDDAVLRAFAFPRMPDGETRPEGIKVYNIVVY